MRARNALLFLLLICAGGSVSYAQDAIALQDVILLAQTQSPQYKLEQTRRQIRYYEYLSYKSNLGPQVSFYGNAPVYSKQYIPVTQPDGTLAYQPVKQNVASVGFSISQQVPFTGGTVSLNTDLNRFDDLQGKMHQYNATPVFLQLNQPLFGFNSLRWAKKIEPLKLEESKRTYVQSLENIAQQETDLYFNALDAQENIRIAAANLKNTQENYDIEKKRISLGTTTEDRLLQLEVQLLTNKQELEKARYNYQVALLSLRASLGSNDSGDLLLMLPEQIPVFIVDLDQALDYARKYRPEFIAFERKRLEAEREVANAKAARQQVNMNATFGLNRAGTDLGTIYSSPRDQQTFSVGFNVPVVDWGRRRAAYNTAKANQQLTAYNNQIDEINFVQEITTLVRNIPLLRGNITLTQSRDTVAGKRYLIADNLYKAGKLSVTDLNIAQGEKDNARRDFIGALRSFWSAYYLLRRITLYDFEKRSAIYQ